MIHIVEPTLEDDAGHCHNFLASLCRADSQQPFTAWIGARAGESVLADLPNVTVRRHFHRRLRRFQELMLVRQLLKQDGKILISTASTTDLALVHLAAGTDITPSKVYLYFHWFRERKGKKRQFQRITRRRPTIVGLGPTPGVEAALIEGGFQHVRRAAYPIPVRKLDSIKPCPEFRSILFAGQARHDKGFDKVVDLVAHLARTKNTVPVTIQIGTEHYGKVHPEIQTDIMRLEEAHYSPLTLVQRTMRYEEYVKLYTGGICLQLYSQQDFADRISTVTLDSTRFGAPIVTVANTWMAGIVERFGAGEVIAKADPVTILQAVENIRREYETFHKRALKAGDALSDEHDPLRLLQAIRG